MATIVCPVCGAKYNLINENDAVIEHNHSIAEQTISNRRKSKTALRLESLKQYGYDISAYSVIDTNGGGSFISRITSDGNTEYYGEDKMNELEKTVLGNGFIKNHNLFSRWMTAQYFRWTSYYGSITNAIREKGYEYSWSRIENELKYITKSIGRDDMNSFAEREIWFNKELVSDMAKHYFTVVLEDYVKNCKIYKKNGVLYINLGHKNGIILLEELDAKKSLIEKICERIISSSDYMELYKNVVMFNKNRIHIPFTKKSRYDSFKGFYDAFKGSGAYNVLNNIIKFHGVRIKVDDKWLGIYESLEYVDNKAIENMNCGYKLLGILKEVVSYNEFNFFQRMDEIYNN